MVPKEHKKSEKKRSPSPSRREDSSVPDEQQLHYFLSSRIRELIKGSSCRGSIAGLRKYWQEEAAEGEVPQLFGKFGLKAKLKIQVI